MQTGRDNTHQQGDVLTTISNGVVGLMKQYYGRGPTRTKTYFQDDLVVCILRGGFSRVEETLLEGGRGDAVIQQRMEFQELMRDRFGKIVEDATGRKVIGFMSGNHQEPDLLCEVFILEPTDFVDEMPADPDDRTRQERSADTAAYGDAERGEPSGDASAPPSSADGDEPPDLQAAELPV